jgi:hypothetical protein
MNSYPNFQDVDDDDDQPNEAPSVPWLCSRCGGRNNPSCPVCGPGNSFNRWHRKSIRHWGFFTAAVVFVLIFIAAFFLFLFLKAAGETVTFAVLATLCSAIAKHEFNEASALWSKGNMSAASSSIRLRESDL